MLRALLAFLLLLNALFFGWTRGWLDGVVGIKATGDREPQRLAAQQVPERIQLLSVQAAKALQQRACVELGPLDGDAALLAAQNALVGAGVPASEWQALSTEQAGVWAVATTRFANKELQARKEEVLKKAKISYEPLSGVPAEMPALLLSRHASDKAAALQMERLGQRAIKALQVIQLQAPLKRHSLVFAQADGARRAQLRSLKSPALSPGFKNCGAAASAMAASSTASSPASAAP